VVLLVDHDIFRLQVAMDDAIGVDIVQSLQNAFGDADGAVVRKSFLIHDLAQQAARAHSMTMYTRGALVVAKRASRWDGSAFRDASLAIEAVGEYGSASMSGCGILSATMRLSRTSMAR